MPSTENELILATDNVMLQIERTGSGLSVMLREHSWGEWRDMAVALNADQVRALREWLKC
jgi:hypothetical protein